MVLVRIGLAVLACLIMAPPAAVAGGNTSAWDVGHKSKARLIFGSVPGSGGRQDIYAGVEIELAKGWKTYWRQPGDAGGVPPYFDWSKSENLKQASVRFPAPVRFKDAAGDAIGYKSRVVFPVMIEAQDPSRPIGLALKLQFGVCREICIPAQAKLAMRVDPARIRSLPPRLAQAIDRVPRGSGELGGEVAKLLSVDAGLAKPKPYIMFEVRFPDGGRQGDLFVETDGDHYLPITTRLPDKGPGIARFNLDLSEGIDVRVLSGKTLRITLVDGSGGVETTYQLP